MCWDQPREDLGEKLCRQREEQGEALRQECAWCVEEWRPACRRVEQGEAGRAQKGPAGRGEESGFLQRVLGSLCRAGPTLCAQLNNCCYCCSLLVKESEG